MKNFKNPKADKARKETYKEAVDLLKKKRSCAIIRPTGFGKTGILTKLLKSGIFQQNERRKEIYYDRGMGRLIQCRAECV